MKMTRREYLGIYIYAKPRNEIERDFNRQMLEKAEAIRCLRVTSLINDKFDTKREWGLRGDTVLYVSAPDIRRAIEYDLEQERAFDYTGLNINQNAGHITQFVSGLWQVHPFGEGNTRTTAVFTIQYLRSMGFNVENDLFAKHSWYFRNALVRANYQNTKKGIKREPVYLERFFRNLLMRENNELKNRFMVVNAPKSMVASTPTSTPTSLAIPGRNIY